VGEVYPQAAQAAIRIAQDSIVLEAAAMRVALVWRAVAAPHTGTGNYGRSIKTTREVYRGPLGRARDWVVYTDDPEALPIEYGHRLFSDTDHDGTATDTGKYVPGLRIANRTYDLVAASGGA
jgi:hypothetical protein